MTLRSTVSRRSLGKSKEWQPPGKRLGRKVETDTGTSRSLVGTTLDSRYQIEEIIGQGGMSTVYRARHLFLQRDVAIKVMQDHLSNTEGRLRFQREAQAVAALSHPNIISVSEFGVSIEGEPYMVMDYLNGASLADLLRDQRRGESGLCIFIFNQVAAALQHAHDKGILHRDLKPSNVMLVRSPKDNSVSVRVVDFGLARFLPDKGNNDHIRLTAAGELVGSPYYMSPEQIRDEELDVRSDIYSLGCLMYETLTGCRPFTDTNAITVLSMHLYEEPPPFAMVLKPNRIPGRMEAVVRRCLEKSRSKRYQSMSELSADLEALAPWQDGPAESTPMNFSQGAPYTPPIVRVHEHNSGVRRMDGPDAMSPAVSQATGAYDAAAQYTLRLDKSQIEGNQWAHWFRSTTTFIWKLLEPYYLKVKTSFEGKGESARKQRISGTRVLIAVLGDSKDLIAEADIDAKKYSVYYKNIEIRKSMNAQEFLVLLSTDNFDIVHLHGKFDKRAIFKDSTGFALRLSDVKRACAYAQVKLLWLATGNNLEWLSNNPILDNPSFNLVMTADRGQHYPKFVSSVMSRLSRGDSLINSWKQVIPNMQQEGQKVDIQLIDGPSEISFFP